MGESPKLASDRSSGAESGLEDMGTGKLENISNHKQEDGINQIRSERSDSFVVDMERLSRCTERDINWNSRITMHRSLSRKGSQRSEERSNSDQRDAINLAGSGVVGEGSPKATLVGSCNNPEKSLVVQMPALMGTMEPIISTTPKAQQIIVTNINAESRSCRRLAKPRSNWIDPWRILFLFATLSSMGTIILIYFTLSMAKLNGDGSSHSQ